jgi:hypothetical protein
MVGVEVLFPAASGAISHLETVLIGEIRFNDKLISAMKLPSLSRGGPWLDPADLELLDLMDRAPSVDPLLVRGIACRRNRPLASAGHFHHRLLINPKARAQVELQVLDLARLLTDPESSQERQVKALVQSLLSPDAAKRTEPLRLALRMEAAAYQAGLEAWTGLLFYRSRLHELEDRAPRILSDLYRLEFATKLTEEQKAILSFQQRLLATGLRCLLQECAKRADHHERLLRSVTRKHLAEAMRQLFQQAPDLFLSLACKLDTVALCFQLLTFELKSARSTPLNVTRVTETFSVLEALVQRGLDEESIWNPKYRHRAARVKRPAPAFETTYITSPELQKFGRGERRT